MDPNDSQATNPDGQQLPQVRDDYTPASFGVTNSQTGEQNAAVDLIRTKIAGLFVEEPSVINEEREIVAEQQFHIPLSRHQQYLESLKQQGLPKAQIEAAWHAYYNQLDDDSKLEVWAEYNSKAQLQPDLVEVVPEQTITTPEPEPAASIDYSALQHHQTPPLKNRRKRNTIKTPAPSSNPISLVGFRDHPRYKAAARHARSIAFALGVGLAFLFVTNNELLLGRIKYYLSPGSAVAGPIIQDVTDVKVGPEARVIIPKLNVDIPIIFDSYDVTKESEFQKRLESGVVHIPGTAQPGQNGNVVIVGHSSSNIFGPEKFKWAFVMLAKLDNGDTFQINYKEQRYIYAVYGKKVVKPSDISVIYGALPQPFSASLITCDPPGTSYNRLVIQANQVFPEPNLSAPKITNTDTTSIKTVPGNAISLTQRVRNWLFR